MGGTGLCRGRWFPWSGWLPSQPFPLSARARLLKGYSLLISPMPSNVRILHSFTHCACSDPVSRVEAGLDGSGTTSTGSLEYTSLHKSLPCSLFTSPLPCWSSTATPARALIMEGCSLIKRMNFPMLAAMGDPKIPVIGQDGVSQLHLLDLDCREPCRLS